MRRALSAVWRYIERHHGEYGVALFLVPALLILFALISISYGLAWLFG